MTKTAGDIQRPQEEPLVCERCALSSAARRVALKRSTLSASRLLLKLLGERQSRDGCCRLPV